VTLSRRKREEENEKTERRKIKITKKCSEEGIQTFTPLCI
jgi:hypothetical protein